MSNEKTIAETTPIGARTTLHGIKIRHKIVARIEKIRRTILMQRKPTKKYQKHQLSIRLNTREKDFPISPWSGYSSNFSIFSIVFVLILRYKDVIVLILSLLSLVTSPVVGFTTNYIENSYSENDTLNMIVIDR